MGAPANRDTTMQRGPSRRRIVLAGLLGLPLELLRAFLVPARVALRLPLRVATGLDFVGIGTAAFARLGLSRGQALGLNAPLADALVNLLEGREGGAELDPDPGFVSGLLAIFEESQAIFERGETIHERALVLEQALFEMFGVGGDQGACHAPTLA